MSNDASDLKDYSGGPEPDGNLFAPGAETARMQGENPGTGPRDNAGVQRRTVEDDDHGTGIADETWRDTGAGANNAGDTNAPHDPVDFRPDGNTTHGHGLGSTGGGDPGAPATSDLGGATLGNGSGNTSGDFTSDTLLMENDDLTSASGNGEEKEGQTPRGMVREGEESLIQENSNATSNSA